MARILGRVRGEAPGPTLVAVGGLHGNEPAGILSLRQVLGPIRGRRGSLRGEFVALAGNRGALARGRRFLERDLNRAWTRGRIRALNGATEGRDRLAEDLEQAELLRALEGVAGDARGPVHVLDLHTTSSMSGPWVTVHACERSRQFALRYPVPVILGLEERVEGTLLEHLSRSGHVGLTFEGGQHEDPRAVDRLKAAVWLALAAAGGLRGSGVPDVGEAWRLLEGDAADMPRVLEVRHRHGVRPADGFRMKAGFVNLQPVREGEVLAHDVHGEIRAPEPGRLLMPLYQEQGEDGFFIVRRAECAGVTR